ncbi:MAG: tRNA (adenosine(37)-N6)-dimethylallyltransferase MiaA [Cucumibacter sp.]
MSGARISRAILIAGPTASGKTRYALEQAEKSGAVIVNADSMQVYKGLAVLTARPGAADLLRARHFLYGTIDAAERYSAGKWLQDLRNLAPVRERNRPLIFVGGTGLYFETLARGLSEIPPISAPILRQFHELLPSLTPLERKSLIEARDPKMAKRLDSFDPQRVARALAVLEATGRSLADWQDEAGTSLLAGWEVERIVLAPPREVIRERIATRFAAMLEEGAVEEVEALLKLGLDPNLPAMKAIGVREIGAWLRGEITREAAMRLSIDATRQYAKRQMTWLRKRMADWEWVEG